MVVKTDSADRATTAVGATRGRLAGTRNALHEHDKRAVVAPSAGTLMPLRQRAHHLSCASHSRRLLMSSCTRWMKRWRRAPTGCMPCRSHSSCATCASH
jgi:hypothetical protein